MGSPLHAVKLIKILFIKDRTRLIGHSLAISGLFLLVKHYAIILIKICVCHTS